MLIKPRPSLATQIPRYPNNFTAYGWQDHYLFSHGRYDIYYYISSQKEEEPYECLLFRFGLEIGSYKLLELYPINRVTPSNIRAIIDDDQTVQQLLETVSRYREEWKEELNQFLEREESW